MRFAIIYIFMFSITGFINAQVNFSTNIDVDGYSDIGTSIDHINGGYVITASSPCHNGDTDCFAILLVNEDGTIDVANQYSRYPKPLKAGSFIGNSGVLIANDSSMFFSGATLDDNSMADIFLLKTNAQGDSIWLRTYGTTGQDVNQTVLSRTDSTLWLFSEIDALNNDDISLMEVDLEGNILWEGFYGDEYGRISTQDIVQKENGDLAFSYMACGTSCFTDSVRMAVTLVDKDGQKKWTTDFAPLGEYIGSPPNGPIVALDNGGFVVGAERNSWSPTSLYPPILVWLDENGNVTQQYDFHDDFELEIHDLLLTSDGIIVGCGLVNLLGFDLGIGGWAFAFTQDGELLWERYIVDQYYPNLISWFNAIEEAPDGGFALAGSVRLPTEYDVWFVKLDSMGCLTPECNDALDILSEIKENTSKRDKLFSIYPNPTSDGQIYIQSHEDISQNKNGHIYIFDSMGREILKTPYVGKIDLSHFIPGLYFMKIENEKGGILHMEKLIFQK